MIKFISFFTIVCFFITNVCSTLFATTVSVSTVNNNYIVPSFSDIVTKSDIFSKYGQVIFNSYKENTPLLVIINDLHNNSGAQKNIEQIISFFKTNSNLNKIILEGAPNKKINTNLLSSIDKNSLPVIADSMLSNGYMSGAEAFIVKNNFLNSYGLEDWNLYIENINKNTNLKSKYVDDAAYLLNSFVKTRIKYPKTKFLSAFTYVNTTNDRIKKIINFCVDNNIDLTLYPQLKKYMETDKYKINKDINKTFSEFLNEIKKRMSYDNYSYIVKLLQNSGNNSKYVANILTKTVSKESPDILLKYKSLFEYFENISIQNSINYYLLLNELDILEKNVCLSNLIDKTEKELFETDSFIHLLFEYSTLSLSSKKYRYFLESKNHLYESCVKYLDDESIRIINNILDDNDLTRYYLINTERDDVFYKNLETHLNFGKESKAEKENKYILDNLKQFESVNIVVSGGFHNHFIDMLKQENISVLSVVPNISSLTNIDNQMLRTNDVVYKSALAPPMVCVQTDLYSLAFIIDSWVNIMTKNNVPIREQFNIISLWLKKNNIKEDFKINSNNEMTLNSKSIRKILEQTRKEIKNIEVKHKKIFDFLWSFNNVKLYSLFLAVRYTLNFIFGNKYINSNIQNNKEENLKINELIVNTEYQKTIDYLNGQMPDVIVITLDKELSEEDVELCKNKINELLKNKNVHVEYIQKQKTGSAIGFADAMSYLKESNLNKSYDKLKAVVIDIPSEDMELIKQELPLPFKNKNLTPLQLALLNGIRGCNKFGDDGGIAFMEARSVYIGAMNLVGDLTFVSSVVNMEEIKKHNLTLIIKDDEDRDRIEKFYYGFRPDDITDIVEKRGIVTRNFYNFNNEKLEQFEVVTGNMLIHFNDNEKYKDFFKYILSLKPAMQKSPERMSVLKHVFKPYLRLINNERHKTDLARNTKMNSREEIEFFDFYTDEMEQNYKENEKMLRTTKFGVYNQIYSHYTRNSTEENMSKLSKIINDNSTPYTNYKPNGDDVSEWKQIPEENITNDSSLQGTYEILKQINKPEQKKDYVQLVDILMEIFRTTYFQNELYTIEDDNTAKLYNLMSDIISNSINTINVQILSMQENSIEKQDFENLKRSLLVMQEYTIEYLRLLDYTTILATLCGYIYPKNSIFETSKIMPINRLIFGFTRSIKNAEIDVRNQMRKVQYLGNNKLMYSLYPYGTLEKDIDDFIEKAQNPKEKTAVGMQKEWGTRRALQRFSTIITAVQSCLATAFVAVMKSAITMSDIVSMGTFLLTGLLPSVFLHRALIWFGWRNNFYEKKKKEVDIELSNMNISKTHAEIFVNKKHPFNELDTIFYELSINRNSNIEFLRLVKNNRKLIKQYHEIYSLDIMSEIIKNNKQILTLLSDENKLKDKLIVLTNEYEKILKELIPDYKQDKKISKEHFQIPKEIRQNKINAILEEWKSIVNKKDLTNKDLDTITNNAKEMIKLTSFNRKSLKGDYKDDLIDALQDVILFYNETINMCSFLPDDKKEELDAEIKMLEKMGEYFVKYYKSLNYLVTLETLYYYRISNGNKMHFLETYKIAAAIRYLFGINMGIYLSRKSLIKNMADVKMLGNEIMKGGLYDGNFEKNIDYFIDRNKNPHFFDLGINESWRTRKMLSRLVPTILFIQKLLTAITTNSFSVRALSISFATGVGLTIFLHWVPILEGFIKTIRIKAKELRKSKNKEIKPFAKQIESIQNSLSKKYLQNLSKVPEGQMPDLIFVIGNEQEYKNEDSLKEAIENIHEYGNFKDVPIEVSVTKNKGDGNSIIYAVDSIMNNYNKLAESHPSLKNKKPEDLKIAILNINGNAKNEITKPLGFEIIKGRQTTAAELALLNAIGMIQNNYTEEGNIVIADPSYLYLGSLYQEENITIFGADITYKQLEEQNLPLLVANEDNRGINKIFSEFDISKINDTVVRESYSRRYDISENPFITLPGYSGMVGISLNNMKVFELIDIVKKYIESYDGEKEEINFVSHVLVPILRIVNNEDMNSYIEILKTEASNDKRANIDKFYRGLFKEFSKFLGNEKLVSTVNLKVGHSSIMTKNINDGFYNEFVSNLSSLQNDEDDIDVFDFSESKIRTENISVIATIDIDKFTTEQLEKILDLLPIKKVIPKGGSDSINIDNEQIKFLLREKGIKQINSLNEETDNCFELSLLEENIEETLSDISKNNDKNFTIAIDINDMFEDDVVYNNFNSLVTIFNNEITNFASDDNYVDEQQLNIEEIYNLLCCA